MNLKKRKFDIFSKILNSLPGALSQGQRPSLSGENWRTLREIECPWEKKVGNCGGKTGENRGFWDIWGKNLPFSPIFLDLGIPENPPVYRDKIRCFGGFPRYGDNPVPEYCHGPRDSKKVLYVKLWWQNTHQDIENPPEHHLEDILGLPDLPDGDQKA